MKNPSLKPSSPLYTHLQNFPSFSSHHFLPLTLIMFDQRKQTPNIHNHILDPVTTLNNNYDNWEPHNFDFQVTKKLGNQFRFQKLEDHEDDGADESGASSPSLWQNSPPRSPVHPITNYRSLSPSSRTQAIARGQWELMEMVKNMPESCFELSLKDIVEQPKALESQEKCLINREKNQVVQNRVNIKKNDQIRKAKLMRSKSVENGGLFLKMVSPVSLRSNKKKKKNSSANTTRASPKPEDQCENSSKSLEKEWWKKRFSGSSSSSSNNSGSTGSSSSSSNSTNSRNNSNRNRKGFLSSCW
ncbi:uncharacterized protein LOC132641714 [Lycium barbarum]|uniref:uncharacterized protein LOC132641714 n=1 Tax=Lycium barbarum TaxID=112863 RepID=UPI00293E4947|nr:uncharacterized protein LOC132641714 [Lycium barbarum]